MVPVLYNEENLSKSMFLFTFFFFFGSLGQDIIVTLKQDALIRWSTKIAGNSTLEADSCEILQMKM